MSHILVSLPLSLKRLLPCLMPVLLATLLALTPVQAQNYLHTNGAQIVNSSGAPVRLTGLNWFGLEGSTYCPHGLGVRSMPSILDQVQKLGYNCVRVPYCNQLFDVGSTPSGIDYGLNPDLRGLAGPQIMDKLVAGCKARGLKVILDRHCLDANNRTALWYNSRYAEQRWISDWTTLAARYTGDDTVIGCDIHNEPYDPAEWGTGDTSKDWRLAAERCGDAILAVNPHLLIIVEGTQTVNGDGYWRGGNLKAAGQFPVRLSVPNQLVYSTHDYPSTVYPQPWFGAGNYPTNLPGIWDRYWGYLVKGNIAPVYVGEWGTFDWTPSDQQWFQSLANYIGANGLSFTFWCLNPDSDDTGGILQEDWLTVNQDKQGVIQPLLAALIGSSGGPTIPAAPTGLKGTAGDGQAALSWTAPAGAVTYRLYRGTTGGGETLLKSGLSGTSFADTGLTNDVTYFYTVAAVNSAGTSPQSAETSAKPVSSGGGTVNVTPLVTSGSGLWWSEEDVTLHSAAPVTALTVTVTVQKIAGISYSGQYNTVGSAIVSSHTDGAGQIVYRFSLAPGQTLAAGASPLFAAQFNGSGAAHSYAGDSYAITVTAGGTTATLNGSFGSPSTPAAPATLTATPGDGQAALSWTAPAGAVTYRLYRGTTGGGETLLKSGLSGTSFADTGLTNDVTYFYTVAAVNSAGTSPQSAETSVTPVSPSGSVTVSGSTTGNSSPWWSEEDVTVGSMTPITALTVTVTVQKTAGISYSGQYNTVGSAIVNSHTDSSSFTVYQFTLAAGQTLPPGTNRLFAAQFSGNGRAHPYSADTYSVTSTAGGRTSTQSGHF